MDKLLNDQIEAALATAVKMADEGCNVTDIARDLRSARDRSRVRLSRIAAEAAAKPPVHKPKAK